jgi:hypothetical protein
MYRYDIISTLHDPCHRRHGEGGGGKNVHDEDLLCEERG